MHVFHEGCQAQWMWQAVCFRHVCPLPWWHVSHCYLYCATSFDIDTLLWHEWKFLGTIIYRDEPDERRGEKWSEKVQRKVRRKTQWKTRWKTRWKIRPLKNSCLPLWDLSRLFSLRSRDLVGNPLSWPLSPEISNITRLNVLKDFIHPILGANLIKAGTYDDMR